ncbi:hypothetical protein LQ757_07970 [Agromyces sp. SYSU K20354]|uniref:hypothetical protein n=1 Tax=Agromyces cavernae TaxID=2898659 RepID=UPI001E4635C4|nr:hypothetical protein [Agromyces cavernae]MCD2442212.1 hypothetical protein [Agromyces cavernae]
MTSSQEPPLTRREMRERERLLEQQTGPATPEPEVQAVPAVQPAPFTPPAPASPPVPASTPPAPSQQALSGPATAPTFAPPRTAGGFPVPQGSPFGGAPSAPAPAPQYDPFSPRPVAPAADPTPAAPISAATPERTLTRRELRAMLDGGPLDEFDDEVEAIAQPPAAPPAPTAHPAAAASQPAAAAAPGAPMPAAPMPAAPMPAEPMPAAPISSSPVAPGSPQPVATPHAADPASAPNAGHWTSQLNVPIDEPEPFDQLLSRGALSHGVPTTTNALILPSLPDQGPLGNQITNAGEIIATGSIDLPRSYGATGVHPSQIDSSDVDRLFDHVEDVGTGVAPVAATRAISTQGASRAMIAPPKKEGMNVPLVLAVTAGVLALGVVATLVIGAVAGLF